MASPGDDRDEQIRRNQSTRGSFDDFASHRAQVMGLLTSAARQLPAGPRRLLILGAGNCNDIDLNELVGLYDQIQLVDLDAAALALGVERQNLAGHPRIELQAPVDLSSSDWRLSPASVVASVCLLSQLIDAVAQKQAGSSADLAARIQEVVSQHLRQLVELVQPGGSGLLITDFASSQTAPELAAATSAELPAVVAALLQKGNFFHGLHPGGLYQRLTADPWFASRISCHIPSSPWNWKVGNRVYAVSALVMRRKIAATGMNQA